MYICNYTFKYVVDEGEPKYKVSRAINKVAPPPSLPPPNNYEYVVDEGRAQMKNCPPPDSHAYCFVSGGGEESLFVTQVIIGTVALCACSQYYFIIVQKRCCVCM